VVLLYVVVTPAKGFSHSSTDEPSQPEASLNISATLGVLKADRYPLDTSRRVAQANALLALPDSAFQYLNQSQVMLEGSQSGYWVKGSIPNRTGKAQSLILRFGYAHLGEGRLILKQASGDIQQHTFLHKHHGDAQFADAYMAFRLNLQPGDTEFLIHLDPQGPSYNTHNIPVELLTPEFYDQQKLFRLLFYAAYFGFIFAMLVYNLILYLRVKYPGYIYYSLYLATFSCGALAATGMIYLLPFPVSYWLIDLFTTLTPVLVAICLIQFGRIILKLGEFYPGIDRYYRISLIYLVLVLPMSQVQSAGSSLFINFSASLIALSMGIVAFIAHRQFKIAGAWVLGLSFASICAGFLLHITLEIWPFHVQVNSAAWISRLEWMEDYAFLISTLIEMSLMSLALASFIRQAEQDKVSAQQEKLEAVLETSRLKDEYSRQLENDVAARTQEISEQKQMLEAHANFRDRFFSYISHEFRTPLSLSMGPILDLENNKYGRLDESLLPPLQLIKHNNERLLNLTNKILELTQNQKSKLSLQVQQFPLGEAITRLVANFGGALKSRDLSLIHNLDQNENRSLNIYYDRLYFDCIITNLLANAVKYSLDHSKLQLDVRQDEDHVFVAISNLATPIAPDQLARIFEENYRIESGSDSNTGYGIGLSLVRDFVVAHGGEVSARSDDQGVTCISFSIVKGHEHLPQCETAQRNQSLLDELSATLPASLQGSADDGQTRILVVDDDDGMRRYLQQLLHQYRFQVVTAKDGLNALQQCRDLMPDLVIADIVMPNMGGLELVENIRNNPRTSYLPIVLLSSQALKQQQIEGIDTGADDYLTKPFVPDELIARVNRILEQRQILRDKFQREQARLQSPNAPAEFTERVNYFVQKHLSDPEFNLEKLAQLMSMDRSTLYRQSKQHLNTPLKTLILDTRLNLAADFLNQNRRVADVAYSVGFNSLSYFSKKFKEKFQHSPSAWQQLNQTD
jgi:signal transduction histidine kinase/DNA-binding response OmpR family regulator